MKYYKIALFSLGLILGGCGTQKIVSQGNVEVAEQSPMARPSQILYSEDSPERESVKHPKPDEDSKIVHKIVKPNAKTEPLFTVVPDITFTAVESANVRVPGNNPLPASGALVLDLDQLQREFCYPYKGKVISDYGRRGRSMHSGVDIKAIPADTIRAVMAGVVRMSKAYSGYGNLIVVRHHCGIETVYSHQLKNLVQPNDVVRAGQAIGLAGRTGRATTEHVHFEVRAACETIDPSKLLDYDNMSLRTGKLVIKSSGGQLLAYNNQSGEVPMTPLVPAVQSEPEKAIVAKSAPAPVSASKSAATKSYHTVKRGDTLSAIARTYSTTVAALCKINNIGKNGVLSLGQRLKVR